MGTVFANPVDKNEIRIIISNEELSLLNQERSNHGLEAIGDETLVDDVIQDELDKQLKNRLDAFKNNKKNSISPMPHMEKWGLLSRVRTRCRVDTFRDTMETIIATNPKRKKEVIEFYKQNCKHFCPQIQGTK